MEAIFVPMAHYLPKPRQNLPASIDAHIVDVSAAPNERPASQYLWVLWRRKWILLAVTVAVLGAVAAGTFTATPLYKSVAEIQVSPSQHMLPYGQMFHADSGSPGYLGTQVVVLKSPALASRVAKQIQDASNEEEALAEGKKLLRNVEITPVLDTEIIRIGYSSPNPARSVMVANAWADEFIEYTFDSRYEATMKAADYLRDQLEQLKNKISDWDEAVLEFERANPQLLLTGDNRNIALDNLAEYYRQLTAVEVELMKLKNASLDEASIEVLPQHFKSPTMQSLEATHTQLLRRKVQLSEQFGPKWPEVVQVEREIAHVSSLMDRELEKRKKEQQFSYEEARARKQKLINAVDEEMQKVVNSHEDLAEYDRLRRESEIDSKLYEGLLQRLREAGVSAGMNAGNIRLINRGELPSSPYSPDVPLNLALGLIVALACGVVAACVAEGLDTNVSAPNEVEALAGAAVFAVIPEVAQRKWLALSPGRSAADVASKRPEVRTLTKLSAEMLEHYLRLHASVALGGYGLIPRVILMTSAMPQEGKTTTSVNFALANSHMGSRTLLVDMDLRRPSIHSRLGIEPDGPGIADYLAGDCQLPECIGETGQSDLKVIHAGSLKHRKNPARLLVDNDRLSRALEMLQRQFEVVIIDSQPLLAVADSMLLARYADAVILVVHSGRTPKAVVKQCSLQLSRAHISLTGVVINKVKRSEWQSTYYAGASYYANNVA